MNLQTHPSGLSPSSRQAENVASPVQKAVRFLFTGIPSYLGWLAANVALVLCFPFFLLLKAAGRTDVIRKICIGFMRFFFLKYLPFVRMYRLEKTGDIQKLERTEKCLVVANHTSWLDAIILLALIPNVRILVSRKYARIPPVSSIMAMLGCIFVDRRDKKSAAEAVALIRLVLENGGTTAVFPEGTRAPKGVLKPFQDIFFALAKEAKVPIVPTILYLDTPFLGPRAENFLTARCAILKIRVLDAVLPSPKEKGTDLAFRVRRQMRRTVADLDAPSKEKGSSA
jgi:1-acyl-sn-glycerol-3-phosphate acyltransferase